LQWLSQARHTTNAKTAKGRSGKTDSMQRLSKRASTFYALRAAQDRSPGRQGVGKPRGQCQPGLNFREKWLLLKVWHLSRIFMKFSV
jgi:hypothetical protein